MQIRRSTFRMILILVLLVTLWLSGGKAGGLVGVLAHKSEPIRGIEGGAQQSYHPAVIKTFMVNTTNDVSDNNVGDCQCHDIGAPEECSLRAAIQEANACAGKQNIYFASQMEILLSSDLPSLTDDGTNLDATSQLITESGIERPGVILDGGGTVNNGIAVQSSYNYVRGLTIKRFAHHGILLNSGASGNNVNTNVVSRNGWNGIHLEGADTSNNNIINNRVGTNPVATGEIYQGVTNWGNDHHGISIWNGSDNYIANNRVGRNGWSGITVDDASGNTVTTNDIGIDYHQDPIGNHSYGVHIGNGVTNVEVSYNDLAYNKRGIYVTNSSSAVIEYNYIYSNTITDGNGAGVFADDNSSVTIRHNHILSNTAVSGGGIAVVGNASGMIYSNTIAGNQSYNSTGSGLTGGGGVYAESAFAAWVFENTIMDNIVTGDPDNHPSTHGGGIFFDTVNSGIINNNTISGNSVNGNNGGGGGIDALFGNYLTITRNKIENNRTSTWSYDGSGIDINYQSTSYVTTISRNWFSGNGGGYGTVLIFNSQNMLFENNVISKNSDTAGLYLLSNLSPITVTNNTFVENFYGMAVKNTDLVLANTIIASNSSYGVRFEGTSWAMSVNANNDVWDNGSGASNEPISFYMTVDPKFFDEANQKYALMLDSPCLDAGSATYGSTTSYNGLSRPQGAGVDIGAYEMFPPVHLPLVLRSYH